MLFATNLNASHNVNNCKYAQHRQNGMKLKRKLELLQFDVQL